ncbi:MAG: L,D-transpeptidase family protein [Anaerolineae bacterium]
MRDRKHTSPTPSTLARVSGALTLVLMVAVTFFVLGLAVRVGSNLMAMFEPEVADAAAEQPLAAAEETPTATAVAPTTTVTVVAPAATDVLSTPTAVPATATPEPTPTAIPPTATPEPTPTPGAPRVVVNESRINVRRGPGTRYERVGQLEPGAEAEVTGWFGAWWQIAYEGETAYVFGDIVTAYDVDDVPQITVDELPGPTVDEPVFEPAPTWAIDEGRWIDVDLSEQRVTAYEGQTPVNSYLVSTGLPATPTPVGQFRIYVKYRYDDMAGADYYLEDVPWVMYFYQGYGFHGVWWHANWGNPMSHGCINQPNEMAEWLFGFAEVGTLVNIHE